ncbi:MAG: hypothetical protein IKD37_03685 [Clostridia bacterium]|nr:hypothetical protein [Clostridia bacterium]
MKKDYIKAIVELMKASNDIALLDLIYQILVKSVGRETGTNKKIVEHLEELRHLGKKEE